MMDPMFTMDPPPLFVLVTTLVSCRNNNNQVIIVPIDEANKILCIDMVENNVSRVIPAQFTKMDATDGLDDDAMDNDDES
eukprot:8535221-Ditylum_brightwellii.AAC.1